jgi:hypothetical protein
VSKKTLLLIVLAVFSILSVSIIFLLWRYFSAKNSAQIALTPTGKLLNQKLPDVKYQDVSIPYGYATLNQLGRTTYTGVIEKFTLTPDFKAKITLKTSQEEKEFPLDPNTLLVVINESQNGEDTQIEWKKLETGELEELLTPGRIISLQFTKANSQNLPTSAEIELNLPEIQTSIMVHSYLELQKSSFLKLFSPKEVLAQTCSGTGSQDYTAYRCGFDPTTGYSCDSYPRTATATCAFDGFGFCRALPKLFDSLCTATATGCIIDETGGNTTNGCFVSTPPPTGTPPPGTCTTGTCETGIANCGVNGWPNGTGTCTGGICCITGGTPPPTPVDPCPLDTCPGYCCDANCGDPCIVSNDCLQYREGNANVQCLNMITGKRCVNIICPNNTIPGTLCGCSGGVACGSPCAGGCVSGSTCRFTNAPGGFCSATGSNTYCLGDTGDNYHTYNPAFVTPKCTSGDTGNSMMQRVSNGATTGFTLAQIQSTCFQSTLAWWQAQNADVTAGGNLISPIPTTTCTTPNCTPQLIKIGVGGYPGVALYQGSYDFALGGGTGQVSNTNWLANTIYQGKRYDYAFFARQIPADVTLNEITSATVNGGDFNSGGTPSRGYVWYHRQGDLTISGNANLVGSRKVVLLVEDGNLNINGRINLQSPGQGFFMAIVGKATDGTKGDILVDGSVSHPTQPELQGIFMADSEFKTGLGTDQLHIKGSVAAWDGVTLQRDLSGNGNSTNPAELLEFDPTLVFTFPREFFRNRLVWKEVSP